MPYQAHSLVTFGGRLDELGTLDETWQCGVRGGSPVTNWHPLDQTEAAAYLNDLCTGTLNLAAWFAAPGSYIPPTATLEWAKIAHIGNDGHYVDVPIVHAFSNVHGATPDAGRLPSYCSVAFSWKTDSTTRYNKRGRIYPPNFGVGLEGGSHLASAVVGTFVNSAVGLIGTLAREGSNFQFEPSVCSPNGGHAKIVSVRVGNVVDVQRRRRNAVPETYQTHAV